MKSLLMQVAIALVVAIIVSVILMYVTKEVIEETTVDGKPVMQVKTYWFKVPAKN
jgi:uncharacterized membrane protein